MGQVRRITCGNGGNTFGAERAGAFDVPHFASDEDCRKVWYVATQWSVDGHGVGSANGPKAVIIEADMITGTVTGYRVEWR
ncbi:MAG TPA: hypothetical protein VM598_10860 [Bdellovibrionota bacterium]|nr:hypothetical protein [Bdellovibrionota bacterium]